MTSWKAFTEEELGAIRANPYVKSATAKMIRFTVAFKEEFWRRYTEEHQSQRRIVEELGFDPEILGQKRIDGIRYHNPIVLLNTLVEPVF
ncbi:MAG: HTH domain-containing protein [Candidatus Fimivivens sp.]